MISVVVPQNRIGGLDVLADSLLRQTHRDFELILVDCIHPYRSHLSFPLGLKVTWLDPGCDAEFHPTYMKSLNVAIEHARGDTVLFLPDFAWMHPDCLAVHAEAQKRTPGPVTLDYRYVEMPPLKPGVPSYREAVSGTRELANEYSRQTNDIAKRYRADLDAGKLDDFMWSIFAEPVTQATIDTLRVELEQKPSAADLATDWNWCSLKNESVPTELLLDMNGFEEEYDASHGWQDSSFSYRLRARGIRWHHGGPGGMVSVVNPRAWSNIKSLREPLYYNHDLCFGSRRAELGLPVNPGFSLRRRREERLRG